MNLWRNLAVAAMAVTTFAACSKNYHLSDGEHAIVIDPTVSRASELSFDSGDRIGVTIVKSGESTPYITNTPFTSNGSVFSAGGTVWYAGSQSATIRAYYPYSSAGEPATFTVQTDQRGSGYTQSDFMTALKSGVYPSSASVPMIFSHKMVKMNIEVTNESSASISEVGILSCGITASVDLAAERVQSYASTAKADIKAHESVSQRSYNAIIAPQQAALTFYVQLSDGSERRTVKMNEAEFGSGRQFTARLTVSDRSIEASLSGEINGWGDNTDLTPDNDKSDRDQNDTPSGGGDDNGGGSDGSAVSWGGVEYPVVTLADGRTWFAANLRYVPAGKSPSKEPDDGNGLWYPCDEGKSPLTDEASVAKYGYYYDAETAAASCPSGWHLPTKEEFDALAAAYPTVEALKASVFGFVTTGCINAMDNYIYRTGIGEVSLWSSTKTDRGTFCFKITVASGSYWNNDVYYAKYGASARCIKDK